MDLVLENTPTQEGWSVRLRVALTRQETSDLFLAGDVLIGWPTEGMLHDGAAPLGRSSMFLSEIVSRPEGLVLTYQSEELARHTTAILERQLRAGIPD
ncbi:MAG: hypothetical protein M5U22_14985 [Thermoleophilia bacterium]|nr:hypothetical protein [Thermoleophilia bacterium]